MFNGILTFVGYLIPKLSLEKNGSDAINPLLGVEIKGFTPFPRLVVEK